jgi:hypothetical protein
LFAKIINIVVIVLFVLQGRADVSIIPAMLKTLAMMPLHPVTR